MSKSIIIIGAGITGLATGCYGQMNGYETQVFELHNLPGGLCTSWQRKGYTFDGCIHWLVGSGKTNDFYKVWSELGAVQGRKFVDHEEYVRVESKDGRFVKIYTNMDRLEQHLIELAPEDTVPIKQMTAAIRKLAKRPIMPDKPGELMGFLDKLKMLGKVLPVAGIFKKYAGLSLQDFAKGFTSPLLQEVIPAIFGLPDFPTLAMLMTLAWMSAKEAGYPIGGSLEFARAIEQRYLALGGKIHYRSRVAKIIVENNRAVGVRLSDGTERRADLVISAADGYATIYQMLEGKYLDDQIQTRYKETPIFAPLVQVSLGINRDLSKEPHQVYYQLDKKLHIGGQPLEVLGVKHYCYDPTLAPKGKSAVVVMIGADYDYWKNLTHEQYAAEKASAADQVIAALEQWYPGIQKQIEVVDVATPLTYERYTGNWKGSMEGWLITTKTIGKSFKKTLPGLENFYMIGQWTEPGGGLPPAARCGRDVIQIICKQDRKRFVTTEA